jgi:hypothetical protein
MGRHISRSLTGEIQQNKQNEVLSNLPGSGTHRQEDHEENGDV